MRRPSSPVRCGLLLIALLAACGGAWAQQAGSPPAAGLPTTSISTGSTDPKVIEAERTLKGAELEALQRDMDLSATRQAEIAAEIAAMEKDRAALNEKLLSTAARVQSLEGSISASEGRLADLNDREAAIRVSLESRKDVLAEVLAAAQRIGRRPPPALIVKPEDALGAVRSAIVLGSVMPELRVEADALSADLAALVIIRDGVEAERTRLRSEAESFAEEQERLSRLLDERRRESETRSASLDEEKTRAEGLAQSAETLRGLIQSLEKDLVSARQAAAAAAEAARLARPAPSDTGRLQPAVAFADAKGRLPLPVRGSRSSSSATTTASAGLRRGYPSPRAPVRG